MRNNERRNQLPASLSDGPSPFCADSSSIKSSSVVGGGGEAVIVEYCIDPVEDDEIEIETRENLIENLLGERTLDHRPAENDLRAHRCCFGGTATVPPTEEADRWSVYLVAQNINDTPHGTNLEDAAAQIGGHVLTAQASITCCTIVMLADHIFDVI